MAVMARTTPILRRRISLGGLSRGLLLLGLAVVSYGLAEFALYVALPVWILEQSESAGAVGMSFILRMLPAFAAPVIGSVVDRFPKRRLMALAGTLSALLVVPVIATVSRGQTLPIYIAILGCSASFLLFNLSRRSAVPEIVRDPGRLTRANSVLSVAASLAQVAGAGLGALVLRRLNPSGVVATAALLYLASGIVASQVPASARATRAGPAADSRPGVQPGLPGDAPPGNAESAEEATERSGVRDPGRAVVLGVVLLMGLEMLAAGPFIAYQIIFVQTNMGLPPEFFGYLFSAQMAGNLLAASFLVGWARKVAPGKLLPLSMGGLALSSVVFLTGSPFWVVSSRLLTGIAVSAKVVADDTLIQTYARQRHLGRTFALGSVSGAVAETTSIALAGSLVPRVPLPQVFAVSATLQACGILVGLRIQTLARRACPGTCRSR
ncbi:MAG: MFS transporter [Chloroflexota bacterium]